MKKTSIILIAAAFLAACGAQDETAPEETAATPETAATEAAEDTVAEPECAPETEENCDHTGTVIVPPDRN